MPNDIRQLAIISDIHAGSTRALLPPDFVTLAGQPIGQSDFQKWLWSAWLAGHDWLNKLTGADPYALVLNGDLTEGNHHHTKEIVSPENADHSKAAVELLESVAARADKTYVVLGTECHTGIHELGIAKQIGAEINPESGQPFWDRLALKIAGVQISVRHHFPATSRSYLEASQHSIQMGNAIVEATRAGEVPPRILIGAHRHRTGHFSDGKSLSVVTRAWQGLTRHGFKVVPDGRPCPSIYLLDWRNRADEQLPEVHYITFDAPASPTIKP